MRRIIFPVESCAHRLGLSPLARIRTSFSKLLGSGRPSQRSGGGNLSGTLPDGFPAAFRSPRSSKNNQASIIRTGMAQIQIGAKSRSNLASATARRISLSRDSQGSPSASRWTKRSSQGYSSTAFSTRATRVRGGRGRSRNSAHTPWIAQETPFSLRSQSTMGLMASSELPSVSRV